MKSTRNTHHRWSVFVILMLLSANLRAQVTDLPFPQSWFGKWQGNLEILQVDSVTQRVPMQLRIGPTTTPDQFEWTIIYGDTLNGRRSYLLKTIDAKQGLYVIDEQNGIQLESYYLGGVFLSWFEVVGNQLLTRIERQDGILHWEVISGKMEPVSTTGDVVIGQDTIPPVTSYPIHRRQRARLVRLP